MKKILLVAVVLSLALSAKAFATDTKAATDTVKPVTTATATTAKTEATKAVEPVKAATTKTVETKATEPVKAAATKATETKPALTASAKSMLKGNITKMDNTNVSVKDNMGKEWTFKVGSNNLKDYKVGDNVEVNYEKDSLKSIAKAK